MVKRCIGCKEEKPIDDFHKDRSHNDGRCSYCRKCNNKRTTEYNRLHKDKALARTNRFRAKHPERIKAYEHSIGGRYVKYKSTAKRFDRVFSLSLKEFESIITQPCHYCNHKPLNGIDRIDSNRDYVIDNCVSCCSQCNLAKNDYTQKEFIDKSKAVYHHSVTPSWAEISLMAHNILERQPRNEIHIYKS